MADGVVSTVTISSVDFEVYSFTADPVADADAWFSARLGASAWTSAVTLSQQQSLVTARRWLDRLLWSGTKTDTNQETEFPRDSLTCRGEALADNLVPAGIVWAEFELALILLADAAAQAKASQGSNVKKAKAGSAEIEFFVPTLGSSLDTVLPTIAQQYAGCFLTGALGSSTFGAYGSQDDDGSSEFSRDYDRVGPLL